MGVLGYWTMWSVPMLGIVIIVTKKTVIQLLCHVQLCDPMDCSMPGFPVLHQLPELTQTHVH